MVDLNYSILSSFVTFASSDVDESTVLLIIVCCIHVCECKARGRCDGKRVAL